MGTVGFTFSVFTFIFLVSIETSFFRKRMVNYYSNFHREYDIKCIIDLHAAPGSQNGMEHSASRDGFTGWPTSPDYISESLHVIEFLISRYIWMCVYIFG